MLTVLSANFIVLSIHVTLLLNWQTLARLHGSLQCWIYRKRGLNVPDMRRGLPLPDALVWPRPEFLLLMLSVTHHSKH